MRIVRDSGPGAVPDFNTSAPGQFTITVAPLKVQLFAIGSDAGRVLVVNAQTGAVVREFFPFGVFPGGLSVAVADMTGDGADDVLVGTASRFGLVAVFDGTTGAIKTQITRGAWPVRHVLKVDEEKRQLWCSAGGMNAGEDPYFQHFYRINLDGSGLTPLTSVRANHSVEFSSDMKFFVDHYSRPDLASVMELHRADASLVAEIDNRVVGFVLGRAGELEFGLPGTVAWIEMIGVDPAHRRRGVAQALVEKFGESAEDHGIRTIFTLVTSNQTEMQHFFSRLGFVHGKMIHYQKELGG